eukprot:gene9219-12430_t
MMRQRRSSPMIILLLMNLFSQFGGSNYPPVTIALLVCNIAIHVLIGSGDFLILGYDLASAKQNCLNPSTIVKALFSGNLLLNRIILSAFIHADDIHLYYNMMSLGWKGANLETMMGSSAFLQFSAFSLIVSHSLLIIIATLLNYAEFDNNYTGYESCAIGFSAVLFSIKLVWNHYSPSSQSVLGLTIPSKYVAWFELVLISIINPNSSFIGHLSGILSGMIYIWFIRHMDVFMAGGRNGNPRYTYSHGTTESTGTRHQSRGVQVVEAMNDDDELLIELENDEVLNSHVAATSFPSVEELRENRLRRLDRHNHKASRK